MKQKRLAALKRCITVRERMKTRHPDWAVVCSFNVCPLHKEFTEPEAMGRCVNLLMQCDMLVYDEGGENSKGMMLEKAVADIYGIPKMPLRFMLTREDLL